MAVLLTFGTCDQRESIGEGGSWIRPQCAGSKPRGTRGAIPLSSSFKGRDPK